jgi:hypothetical protein
MKAIKNICDFNSYRVMMAGISKFRVMMTQFFHFGVNGFEIILIMNFIG